MYRRVSDYYSVSSMYYCLISLLSSHVGYILSFTKDDDLGFITVFFVRECLTFAVHSLCFKEKK